MSDITVQTTVYAVLVLDMFHYMDPDEQTTVSGFSSLELAREYAHRRTRDSVEEQRGAALSAEDLRGRWFSFGEDCLVLGDTYRGAHELGHFISHPATPEERDWQTLAPAAK